MSLAPEQKPPMLLIALTMCCRYGEGTEARLFVGDKLLVSLIAVLLDDASHTVGVICWPGDPPNPIPRQ